MIENNLKPGSFIIIGYNAKKLVYDFVADKLGYSAIKLINHPDCKIIENCDIIEIDNVREASYFLNLTPSLFKNKFLIIDNFHLANIYAQNAFLKTFEEPPNYAYIFLLTPYEDRLLSTIRSRAQTIRVIKNIASELKKQKFRIKNKPQTTNYKLQILLDMNYGQRLIWLDKELNDIKEKSNIKRKILEIIDYFFIESNELLKKGKIDYKNLELLKETKFKIEQGFPNAKILFENFLLSL